MARDGSQLMRGRDGTPSTLRAATVAPSPHPNPPPDLSDSPLYLLAVLFSARRSRDRALERVTRRRLDALGIRIAFGDELPSFDTTAGKGARNG